MDGFIVADAFNALGLPSVRARAVTYKPSAGAYAGTRCSGVMLHVTDPEPFRPVGTGIALVALIRDRHPADFQRQTYPTAVNPSGINHFDRLAGTPEIRRAIEREGLNAVGEIDRWTRAPGWAERVKPALRYEGF